MKTQLFVLVVALGLIACKREPTIVIRFEPLDLGGAQNAMRANPTAAPQAMRPSEGSAECKTVDDCAFESVDCCDCAHGGARRAASKISVAKTGRARADKCKDTMCTAMMSNDPSCSARLSCAAGRCTLN